MTGPANGHDPRAVPQVTQPAPGPFTVTCEQTPAIDQATGRQLHLVKITVHHLNGSTVVFADAPGLRQVAKQLAAAADQAATGLHLPPGLHLPGTATG